MLHFQSLVVEFFSRLEILDQRIASAVAAERCQHCSGPLHRTDYERKPRGGLLGVAGESSTRRHSLCCGWVGCRKRALPPSLRFLGRRVYLEVVVVLACVWAQVVANTRATVEGTGVPARTLKRWGTWWREIFPSTRTRLGMDARFVPPPPDVTLLPRSLVERVERDLAQSGLTAEALMEAVMLRTALWLAPVTTNSVVEGSRFVVAVTSSAATF
jgi:hypothetical protein